jgi:DNA polymerase V
MNVVPVNPKTLGSLSFYLSYVAAGFPSPADDYAEQSLSIDELLIKHPSATYLVRASGDSMIRSGIFDQDILIVDRAVEPKDGDIVIAGVDGELTCKYLNLAKRCLVAANPAYPAIPIRDEQDMVIEGVVISSIRLHRSCTRS